MSEDQFIKLFKYVEEFRRDVNARFDETATKKQVDALAGIVDGLAGLNHDFRTTPPNR